MDFNPEDYDVSVIADYLENENNVIDCGTDNASRIEAVQIIHQLGFHMGGWYREHMGERGDRVIRWRYLFQDAESADIHMFTYTSDENRVISMDAILQSAFIGREDPASQEDLAILYPWMVQT